MTKRTNRIEAADGAALSAVQAGRCKASGIGQGGKVGWSWPTVPRRQLCRSSQSVRAAVHAAEFAEWQASGGDFLHSSLAELFIRAYRTRTL